MSTEIAPSQYCASVTPSDSTLLTRTVNGISYAPRSIYVGGTGDLVAEFADGSSVTFTGVSGGSVLPIRPQRVKAATTATAVVAIY